ncbi:MAG: hypothetical protein ABI142_01400, partial [Bryocella sp.]
MRKLIAIAILAFLGLPFATSAFALMPMDSASLPACCRKAGKHHCAMTPEERGLLLDTKHRLGSLPSKCPFAPQATHVSQVSWGPAPAAQRLFVFPPRRVSAQAQVKCQLRISEDRSRQKRGPP